MKLRVAAIVALCVACSTFDGFEPRYIVPQDWGGVEIAIGTVGLSLFDKNTYTVALDSALQGYAVRRSEGGVDTVHIEPILAGRHVLTLSGVRPYCQVAGGPDRAITVVAGVELNVAYRVDCVYP